MHQQTLWFCSGIQQYVRTVVWVGPGAWTVVCRCHVDQHEWVILPEYLFDHWPQKLQRIALMPKPTLLHDEYHHRETSLTVWSGASFHRLDWRYDNLFLEPFQGEPIRHAVGSFPASSISGSLEGHFTRLRLLPAWRTPTLCIALPLPLSQLTI
ncbi:uncharacterized protein BO80DRAFT_63442 [Aspergillus ibericus CBS 121593]|uniref:Uncharacterized protein n=1 Tax=Aspergillus ibericus CBS 121593 TaxID=1448316 RepID=A0A395H0V4_9EURO|nr:hypothetical protein BO80DRAFT_63442 [Aspergillus ibericus CBS 121593]RAL01230.1 hypothetical protein BO80DRAFT_63442 [Aspergillus ibericus CBS 121593]